MFRELNPVRIVSLAALALTMGLPARAQAEDSRFRAAMNIELQILDPYITTATVTRAFGYMVYDTLIAMDSEGVFHPMGHDPAMTGKQRCRLQASLIGDRLPRAD
jgi:hypothetical protein